MAEVINLRRLLRSSEKILNSTKLLTENEVARLTAYLETLVTLIDTVRKKSFEEENQDLQEEVTSIEARLREVQRLLEIQRRKEGAGIELPEATELESKLTEDEAITLDDTSTCSKEQPKASSPDSERPVRRIIEPKVHDASETAKSKLHTTLKESGDCTRKELFGTQRDQSFEDFFEKANAGSNAIAKQLQSDRETYEDHQSNLSELVNRLKHKALSMNDRVRDDTDRIGMVHEKVDSNLNYVGSVSKRLNLSLRSATFSYWKMCTGFLMILALWFGAYLVMRLLPRVRR